MIGVVSAKLSQRAALVATGVLPENVNYAVKSSFLLSFLESVPELASRLKEPSTTDVKFADVVEQANQASALVIVYPTRTDSHVELGPPGAGGISSARLQMGTWKLNQAKSKATPGMGKVTLVTYKNMLGNVKVSVDGVDAKGKPTHSEWSGKIDGKDYPVTGDPTSDARSYTKVNDRTMDFAVKKGGRTMITGRILVAADGKSRTVTTTGIDSKGKKLKTASVYDKQ